MKQMKCYDCENVFEAIDSKSMLDQFYVHYMSEHKEIITGGNEEEKKAWMVKFNEDWSKAEDK